MTYRWDSFKTGDKHVYKHYVVNKKIETKSKKKDNAPTKKSKAKKILTKIFKTASKKCKYC